MKFTLLTYKTQQSALWFLNETQWYSVVTLVHQHARSYGLQAVQVDMDGPELRVLFNGKKAPTQAFVRTFEQELRYALCQMLPGENPNALTKDVSIESLSLNAEESRFLADLGNGVSDIDEDFPEQKLIIENICSKFCDTKTQNISSSLSPP